MHRYQRLFDLFAVNLIGHHHHFRDAMLPTGAKPLLLRAFFEAIVRVAHATGDASLSLADRVLALMKESVIPFARTDSASASAGGTSASAFMAEFASPPVRDKLAQVHACQISFCKHPSKSDYMNHHSWSPTE